MNIDVLKLLTESKNKLPIGEGRRFSREDRENSISKEKLQKESNFREILAEVRENNIRSTNITDDSVKIRERNNVKDTKEESDIAEKYYNKSEINPEYIPQDLIASSETEEILEIDPALSEKAGKILEEALKKICDALNLTTLPIDEINFVRITESIEEQFAEILFLVGKIIEDIENGAILPEDKKIFGNTDALLDTLLTNKFKIELAFNMLGVSENIQKKVDNRNGVNGFDGIIKATEPSQIKMPTLHSEKIFNSFSGIEREKTIEAIIEKIKQLISEDSGEFTLTISEKVQKGEELAAFDSKTYRCILKIDKPVDSSVKSEKNLEEVIAIPTDNKNQLSSEGNGSKFEEALLNRGDFVFTNGRIEITTQQSLDRGYNSLSSNILKEEEITEQITAKFRGMIKNGLSEVKVLLKPESLGEVRMQIRMEGDVVMAKIEVENRQVKEIMERNLPLLREALSQHNLTAGTFQIDTYNDRKNEEEAKYDRKFDDGRNSKNSKEERNGEDEDSEKKKDGKNNNIEFLV